MNGAWKFRQNRSIFCLFSAFSGHLPFSQIFMAFCLFHPKSFHLHARVPQLHGRGHWIDYFPPLWRDCEIPQILRPKGIEHDRISLSVFYAAPHIKRKGDGLRIVFAETIYLTCVITGIRWVCKKVRILLPEVDSMIANIQKVFLKAPPRIRAFQARAPHLALPLKPIRARWKTLVIENFAVQSGRQETMDLHRVESHQSPKLQYTSRVHPIKPEYNDWLSKSNAFSRVDPDQTEKSDGTEFRLCALFYLSFSVLIEYN